jgi:amino-acid N-acetyltransferase
MIDTLERADATDLHAIAGLLRRNALPTAAPDNARVVALVARADDMIIGSEALELYDDAALLRSIVVDASARGQGLGQRLTHAALIC